MARHFVAASQQHLYRNGVPVGGVPLTLSVWAKATSPTTLSSFGGTLCKNITNGWFVVAVAAGKPWVYEYDGTTAGQIIGPTAMAANVWVHLCGVFHSDASRACFLNGGEKTLEGTAVAPPGLDFTTVGMLIYNGALHPNFWDGDLAEFAIYNAALSDAEVAQLAAGNPASAVRPGSLAAYYPLLGTASPEPDVKGGAGLILVNGPTQAADHPPIQAAATGGAGRMFQVF